jgi:hypothetical protein
MWGMREDERLWSREEGGRERGRDDELRGFWFSVLAQPSFTIWGFYIVIY